MGIEDWGLGTPGPASSFSLVPVEQPLSRPWRQLPKLGEPWAIVIFSVESLVSRFDTFEGISSFLRVPVEQPLSRPLRQLPKLGEPWAIVIFSVESLVSRFDTLEAISSFPRVPVEQPLSRPWRQLPNHTYRRRCHRKQNRREPNFPPQFR